MIKLLQIETVHFLPHTVYQLSADVTPLPRCMMGMFIVEAECKSAWLSHSVVNYPSADCESLIH